jgi:hypothetical protein
MSNLDSIIASAALVFLRYSILTYLSFKENHRFYEVLEKNRNNKCFNQFTCNIRNLNYSFAFIAGKCIIERCPFIGRVGFYFNRRPEYFIKRIIINTTTAFIT